jgi:hypothetical protein
LGSASPVKESGARFTFRANRDLGRHGWLRLTPAYSVGLVQELTAELGPDDRVLDPFCGTGTTALACGEQAVRCDTLDINPFLIWLTRAKCATYSAADLEEARSVIAQATAAEPYADDWRPPLSKIERWWDEDELARLAAAWRSIKRLEIGESGRNLAKLAFCRGMMAASKASFRHQSMSFKSDISQENHLRVDRASIAIGEAFALIERSMGRHLSETTVVIKGDARRLELIPDLGRYSAVITSPPYPNRMSYVRELRPYMYWLGYLSDGRAAGELDWEAIGGTWGIATSNLSRWTSDGSAADVVDGEALIAIQTRSPLLANYVRKYVEDMASHIGSLPSVLRSNARATYIVGNSHFYGVPIETQEIFADLFRRAGFVDVAIRTLRKRTSKTGLFEYAVSAVWK